MSQENFTVVWSFRNRIDILTKSILSADKTCPKEVNFCLVDGASDDNTIKQLRLLCNEISARKVRICESAYRTTCQEAWNLGIMLSSGRYVILTSSDCIFLNHGWFEVLKNKMKSGSQYVLIENHSVFCIDKKLVGTIGFFDEAFSHGPHVDVDYMIRTSEQNISVDNIPNRGFYTHKDDIEITKKRLVGEVADRLPMHDFINEDIFNSKWESGWVGWRGAINSGETALPHPPTHISQVKRKIDELEYHSIYKSRYKY